ncbi:MULTISPECIES: hypothetical protein [Staphylococcus]|uniref:hypothetical protein n=1 Tax=Staphylococcus TaxID=1279 RepID=UPI00068881ED|nr:MULTISPECIES: hypothetical protein [Staphylococcus]MBM6507662.1 hypothetical protein [Staphylococcus pasteuri]PTU81350.1 hypothetical protein BUZ66_10865 [Staphylococcus pasteuri]PTU83873.1 hypothetical protein BUZ67_09530 [Staphylococcus pasteuri]QQT20595.1 hypothetical protein I6J08_01485 [Staphylococcus pasteuri]RIO39207.1 hypothetical protein BUZ63_08350 [Staphylococcus pasteuri]
MIKKITTTKHTYLIEETYSQGDRDCYFGRSILLSIYVSFNIKTKSKSGEYYLSNIPKRIVLRNKVIKEEKPTDLEIKFWQFMNTKKTINYSQELALKYKIVNYIKFYFILSNFKFDESSSCRIYYDYNNLFNR